MPKVPTDVGTYYEDDMRYKYRKQYRLPYYNYACTNLYFVTICTHQRQKIFGDISNGVMVLSEIGKCVERAWKKMNEVREYASTDAFVLMPDHLHGIIRIDNPDAPRTIERMEFRVQPRSLSSVVRDFKSAATTSVGAMMHGPEYCLWQKKFHDRIIRNEKELNAIRNYIETNPIRWEEKRR